MVLEHVWVFPVVAVALLLVIVVALIAKSRKDEQAIPLANTFRIRKLPEYASALRKRRLGLIVTCSTLVLAIATSALVMARPVVRHIENPVKFTRDIVLCLDVSGSMIEVDLSIIQKFKQLLEQFDGERVSLIVFNSISSQVFPLTDDYDYMEEQLDHVYAGFFINPANPGYDIIKYTAPDTSTGASLIGDGLTACSMSFDLEDEERSRSIVLATDNVVNGTPTVELEKAVGYAKNKGIKIYAINPGSVDFETKEPLVKFEEELREAAISTGGMYFPLAQKDTIPEIVNSISADSASETKAEPVVTWRDDPNLLIWILLAVSLPALILFRRFARE